MCWVVCMKLFSHTEHMLFVSAGNAVRKIGFYPPSQAMHLWVGGAGFLGSLRG